ncbi:endochitinase At2g43620-like [Copidosoma floridanum]|uniref:endochitinase At2g43620-like n=1 Tax=Copidosoma floridanum TaxID=29053 RepID=UPI0006C9BCF4|nr:endochitinase At2g43620-like [Copidosoma floridanum]XP_014208558.1 endochitinase At2g43620-like [Copidosoma floridanum]XP_023248596.1 endochitinase At2g43620-like [Copidosoma floridanum]
MQIACLLLLIVTFSIATAVINSDDFNAAIIHSGFQNPSNEIYGYFNAVTSDFHQDEAAMFLAQLLHESAGFKFVEEIACKKTKCPDKYIDKVGLPGKYYYGRGYIQLTWGRNYKEASKGLGLGDRLLEDPDLVASDKNLSMQVSSWFWMKNVRPRIKKHPNQFGITTRAINGGECRKYPERAKKRWDIYRKIAELLNVEMAAESGCYN